MFTEPNPQLDMFTAPVMQLLWLGKKLEEIIRNYPRIRVIIKLKKHIFSGIISSNYFNFFPKRPLGLNK